MKTQPTPKVVKSPLWTVVATRRNITPAGKAIMYSGAKAEETRLFAKLIYDGQVVHELEGSMAEVTLKLQAKAYNKAKYRPDMRSANTKILADYRPKERGAIMLETGLAKRNGELPGFQLVPPVGKA